MSDFSYEGQVWGLLPAVWIGTPELPRFRSLSMLWHNKDPEISRPMHASSDYGSISFAFGWDELQMDIIKHFEHRTSLKWNDYCLLSCLRGGGVPR